MVKMKRVYLFIEYFYTFSKHSTHTFTYECIQGVTKFEYGWDHNYVSRNYVRS